MRNIHQEIFCRIADLVEAELGPDWSDYNGLTGNNYADQIKDNLYRKLSNLFIEMMPEGAMDGKPADR